MIQQNTLTSLVLVEAYETRTISESFFEVYEKNKIHFWENPKPSLAVFQHLQIDSNEDIETFVGKHVFSFSNKSLGLVEKSNIINNKKYLTCSFNTIKTFQKNDIVLSYNAITRDFTNEFSFFVKEIISRLPLASPENPSLNVLEKSLRDYEHKQFEQFLGNTRINERYIDIMLLERDKKTQQRKTWYLQAEKKPFTFFEDINRDQPRFSIRTAKGQYVVQSSSLKII